MWWTPDYVSTGYSYDLMKRRVATSVYYGGTNAITTTNILDGAGRVLVAKRIDTTGAATVLQQTAYDVLGRPTAQTNALGGVTYTTYSGDGSPLIVTNVYPDTGTRIETNNADGRLQSIAGTAVSPMQYVYGAVQDGTPWREFTQEIKLVSGGTNEWTKTYTDGVGRGYKKLYATASGTNAFEQPFYNNHGQLAESVDADTITTLYQYKTDGELEYQAIDLNQNDSLDMDGSDRVTQTERTVLAAGSGRSDRVQVDTYAGGGTLVSSVESSTDGLTTWQSVYPDGSTPVTTTNITSPGSSRTQTNMAPNGSYLVSAYSYSQLSSVTNFDSTGAQIGKTSYGYDTQGRQNTVTDARNGTTTNSFNNADQVTSVTTPNPGSVGGSAQTTTMYYDNSLRATNIVYADGTSLTNIYYQTGQIKQTSGSRTYPVGYSYDAQGRMQTMTNWTGFATTGARVTTWNYDAYRGFLASKSYADSTGPSYTYTGAGRLATRLWARGTNTTYSYTTAGDVATVLYNDSLTPGITNGYDGFGRLSVISNGPTVCTLTYNDVGEVLSESYAGGVLAGFSVTNGYDADLRRIICVTLSNSTVLTATTNNFDAASRLSTVSDGTNSATYSYIANSPLVSQIVFKQSGTTRMTTSKQYDNLNRLSSIGSVTGSTNDASDAYGYNAANQRVRNTLADGSYWNYQYDSLGQVIAGNKYWSDGTPVAGQQFDYTFDSIGNRTQTKAGGDQYGGYLRVGNYTNNSVNQITGRDVPGAFDVLGDALATNTVTVNSLTPYRKGEYYREQLTLANSSSAVWTNITVASPGQTSVTGNAYVAKTPEIFAYDTDGNLTNDGRWTYKWDAENRLLNMTSLTNAPTGSKRSWTFFCDYKGRRIQKTVSTNSGSGYVGHDTNSFLYDGWNLVAELVPNGALTRSYIWGNDLSGSMHGAGGVGGLLALAYYGSSTTNCFVAYDGNGNVSALANAASGSIVAQYEYGPFGELIRATGPMAKANPFRFSTQYQDDETDLICYAHRYYNPSTGRWLSKDPLGELGFDLSAAGLQPYLIEMSDDDIERVNRLFSEPGGLNLYAFCANSPVTKIDRLGLDYNWGTPGPIPPAEPGAYGPFYNPEPSWFMHPADEGKPCCCKDGPAKITVKRTDNAGLLQIVMKIDLQITGCYKDLFVIWDTCWRFDDAPWGPQSAGALWGDLNSTSSLFEAYGTVYRTKAHVRLLSCEDGKWKVRGAKAGRGYSRSFPGLPWSSADTVSYY